MTQVSEQEAEAWLAAYGLAWEQGDTRAVLRLFAPDAAYHETPFDPPIIGHAAIGRYWDEGAAEGQRDVRYAATLWAVKNAGCFAHWRATFTRVSSGAPVRLDGAFHLTFARDSDGRLVCTELREWWHRA